MAREIPSATRPALTPLIDIAFLVLIFFMALPLRRLDGKLEAYLPQNAGPRHYPDEQPDIVHLRVRPGPVYQLGDRTAESPRAFTTVLKALGPGRAYEIHASEGVRWGSVVTLVDLLKELELTRIRFRGAAQSAGSKRR